MIRNNFIISNIPRKDGSKILYDSNKKSLHLLPSKHFNIFIKNKLEEKSLKSTIINTHSSNLLTFKEDELNTVKILISNTCNMSCKYCYADGGNYGKDDHIMSYSIYKNTCNYLYTQYKKIREIVFFGGEPLLNINAIKYICNFFEERVHLSGYMPRFSIITNGTLLNKQILNILSQYNIQVIISLDSDEDTLHNCNRVFNNQSGTFDVIDNNIKKLTTSLKKPIAIESTYTKQHLEKAIPVHELMKRIHLKYGTKVIMVQKESSLQLNDYPKELIDYLFNFKEILNLFFKYGISNHQIISFLSSIKNNTYSNYFCDAAIGQIAISSSGDIYPCQMFISCKDSSNFKIGNVLKNEKNNRKNFFINQNRKNKACVHCISKNFCKSCAFQNYKNNYIQSNLCENYTINNTQYYKNIEHLLDILANDSNFQRLKENIEHVSEYFKI